MNRLTYNLIFWPCFLLGVFTVQAFRFSPATGDAYLTAQVVCIIASIVCFVVAGIRTKTLGRSLWNLLWLIIPFACFIYALFIGISNKKV